MRATALHTIAEAETQEKYKVQDDDDEDTVVPNPLELNPLFQYLTSRNASHYVNQILNLVSPSTIKWLQMAAAAAALVVVVALQSLRLYVCVCVCSLPGYITGTILLGIPGYRALQYIAVAR